MSAKIFFTLLFTSFFQLSNAKITIKSPSPDHPWGFFGHKLINRLAVFTLPPEMIVFYKKNIEFITAHAVDPDMRRYASKYEGPRHFMDLDRYGKAPFSDLPRNWTDALLKYTDVFVVTNTKDTILLIDHQKTSRTKKDLIFKGRTIKKLCQADSIQHDYRKYRQFFVRNIQSQFYEDEMLVAVDSLKQWFPISKNIIAAFATEDFSKHGIVPYHLEAMQERLTNAFKQKDINKILRLSAEFGHYIGDAHVPLHTTENYNGQLTNQHGIHGFWESRIPELFSEDYDFWVGKANYIEKTPDYFWKVVLESHQLVDSVLAIEKRLSQSYPSDQIMCLEERLGHTIKTYCSDYAKAFSDRLEGQVERRMRDAILAVGSVWFTAWVNAGQPNLELIGTSDVIMKNKEDEDIEKASNSGKGMIGRGEN
jgi:hypothetical protein